VAPAQAAEVRCENGQELLAHVEPPNLQAAPRPLRVALVDEGGDDEEQQEELRRAARGACGRRAFWASGVHACGEKRGRWPLRSARAEARLRTCTPAARPPCARDDAPPRRGARRRGACGWASSGETRKRAWRGAAVAVTQRRDRRARATHAPPLIRARARCSSSAVPADMRATRSARCSRQPGAIESATSRSPSLLTRSHASVLLLRTRCRVCRHGNVRGVAAAASWRMDAHIRGRRMRTAWLCTQHRRPPGAHTAVLLRVRVCKAPPEAANITFSSCSGRAWGICGWGSPA
jgi:hypothetical protein